jgi:hypothetical protein
MEGSFGTLLPHTSAPIFVKVQKMTRDETGWHTWANVFFFYKYVSTAQLGPYRHTERTGHGK